MTDEQKFDSLTIKLVNKKWHCSKGHEWESLFEDSIQILEASPHYCLRCFREQASLLYGIVTEVKNDT